MPGWVLDAVGAVAAAVLGGLLVNWWKETRNARQNAAHQGLVGDQHCHDCRQEIEEELQAGDERMDVLSRGMAFLLRQIPKLCAAVGAPGCQEIEREANHLADELLLAGKGRVRNA